MSWILRLVQDFYRFSQKMSSGRRSGLNIFPEFLDHRNVIRPRFTMEIILNFLKNIDFFRSKNVLYCICTVSVLIQYRYSTNTIQIQYRYSTDSVQIHTVQIQYYLYRYSTDTVQKKFDLKK